jgi:hypothetical protein
MGAAMTTIEKMKAMNAAFKVRIGLNINDQWYASGPEQGGDGMLRGMSGRGSSPEEAIDDLWNQIVTMASDRHLRLDDDRRVRWNGFMWETAYEVIKR